MKTSVTYKIRHILSEGLELLAPSIDNFFKFLGYSGRTTYYNIMSGNTGKMDSFLKRLNERFGIDEEYIDQIYELLIESKDYFDAFDGHAAADIVGAAITGDTTKLDNDEVFFELGKLQISKPFLYYRILAFYLAKEIYGSLPKRKITYEDKCAEVMRLAEEKLYNLFPDFYKHTLILDLNHYNKNEFTLYLIVDLIAQAINSLVDPDGKRTAYDSVKLKQLGNRSYWVGFNKSLIILLFFSARDKNYKIFSFDREEVLQQDTTREMVFLRNGQCITTSLDKDGELVLTYGKYDVTDDKLIFEWDGSHNPTGLGDYWRREDISHSQFLRNLNGRLTEELLYLYELQNAGLRLAEDLSVDDVICSRESLTLKLSDGRRYELDLATRPIFRQIRPFDEVVFLQPQDSDEVIVSWTTLGIIKDLEEFTLVHKEK